MYGFVIRDKRDFGDFHNKIEYLYSNPLYGKFFTGISCCHSLEKVKDKIIGDPLEESLFNITENDIKEIQSPYNKDEILN